MKTVLKLARLSAKLWMDLVKFLLCVLLAGIACVSLFGMIIAACAGMASMLESYGVKATADNVLGASTLVALCLLCLVVGAFRVRHHWKRLN